MKMSVKACQFVVLAGAMLVSVPAGHTAPAAARVTLVHLPDGGIQPQVTVDARGIVHVLYFKGDAAHGDLFYVRLQSDGTFSKPLRVNSRTGAAVATGSMRGGHLAIGKNGRVHVAWPGSGQALPKAAGDATPVLYTRMNDAGTGFEPERNVVQQRVVGLDGGTVAADPIGNVYVAWHAFEPDLRGEADRRVWVTRSRDDGRTFSREEAASDASTGACGCCGVGALADRRGTLYLLYRAAIETVHRDTYLLTSRDKGTTFTTEKVQEWNIGACPMSTFALAASPSGVLAAWETDGQVQWLRIDPISGRRSPIVSPPGSMKNKKHPVIAGNARGETILAWTENTGWNKGGSLAWQVFDRDGKPIGEPGRSAGVPTWSLVAAATRPGGEFLIVY
jgi:hypothetical protein